MCFQQRRIFSNQSNMDIFCLGGWEGGGGGHRTVTYIVKDPQKWLETKMPRAYFPHLPLSIKSPEENQCPGWMLVAMRWFSIPRTGNMTDSGREGWSRRDSSVPSKSQENHTLLQQTFHQDDYIYMYIIRNKHLFSSLLGSCRSRSHKINMVNKKYEKNNN